MTAYCPRPLAGATPKAAHPMREDIQAIKESPYPHLHHHNHPHNPCNQPVFGTCEADFVRDGYAVCAGPGRTPPSLVALAGALPGASHRQLVRVALEPPRCRPRLTRPVPVSSVDVGAYAVPRPFDLRPVRQCVGGGVASQEGRWLV